MKSEICKSCCPSGGALFDRMVPLYDDDFNVIRYGKRCRNCGEFKDYRNSPTPEAVGMGPPLSPAMREALVKAFAVGDDYAPAYNTGSVFALEAAGLARPVAQWALLTPRGLAERQRLQEQANG